MNLKLKLNRSIIAGLALSAILLPAAALAQQTPDFKVRAEEPGTRSVPTNQIIVYTAPGFDAGFVSIAYNLRFVSAFVQVPNAYVFAADTVTDALGIQQAMLRDGRVQNVFNNELVTWHPRSFTPNDPLFPMGVGTPTFGQWHLRNTQTPGADSNVWPAWQAGVTGSGVAIGIVDDGLETAHEDLAPNYSAGISWNFANNNANPNPVGAGDNHGTAVAGVAAARGGNGIGVSGAAPFATLGGIRISFGAQLDSQSANAVLFKSSGTDTSIKIKNHSYGVVGMYIPTPAQRNAISTSAAAGTLHVWAAGNRRNAADQDIGVYDIEQDVNVLSIAAIGSNMRFASYSSFGAAIIATAPSSSNSQFSILTTDRSGSAGYNGSQPLTNRNYTMTFGGTSSAAPLAAGVLALVKEVQPNLNTRFAKHLVARYSTKVDPTDNSPTSDGGWKTNGAGLEFNQNYGFGMINGGLLVEKAPLYSGVTALQTESVTTQTVNQQIPDNNLNGITRTFQLNSTTPLEEMLVTLNITHSFRGDIEAFLTSPMGTTARMLYRSANGSGQNINWTFTMNQFWGENPQGTWTLRVRDVFQSDTGTWNNYSINARMGTLIDSTPTSSNGIVWRNNSIRTVVGWQLENGVVTGSTVIGTPTTGWFLSASGDINGNGVSDMIWRNSSTGQIAVWFLDSNLTVVGTATVGVVGDQNWQIVDAADANGNGTADLLWYNGSTSSVVQWLLNADATVAGTRTIAVAPADWSPRAMRSINGNAVADIIWQRSSSQGEVAVWFMNANGTVASSQAVGNAGSSSWQLRTAANVFSTEQSLVFQNTSTNAVAYWRLNTSGSVIGTGSLGSATSEWVVKGGLTY
jgi:subtilisin-like proprotein convertase family protein